MSTYKKSLSWECILQHTYLYHCLDKKKTIFGIFEIFQIFHARIAPLDILKFSQKRVVFGDQNGSKSTKISQNLPKSPKSPKIPENRVSSMSNYRTVLSL